ncbi:hypothetical protein MJO28_005608 [Puccinia striiformis f. sp. tritici]|uniref:Uncharacterized protein n=1 Tax=Puccinia striiformis f. sp. tritici TaxID=168172 RepID=A0ACC0EL64_9BASI|nr:hypothetical protein MJO28_005608 [Puccinia striiformis f. sp. tritici]KAI9621027.1 hypothetical protein KEM48_007874 [Puccinia striiformis f. sp. tritici PST-130]
MSNPKVSHEPDIPDCEVSGQTMRQQESSIVQPNSLDKMASESNPYFIPSSPNLNSAIFKGSILVLPVVSLANVPQLAVDLMIHNTQLGPVEKVGILDPQDHIPVVGAIDYPSDLPQPQNALSQITTPVQVYQTQDKRYTFVQQRSPVIKARKDIHVSRMKEWISTAGFGSVLMLVSVDAATRSDAHLRHPSSFFHYVRAKPSDPSSPIRQFIQTRYASFLPQDSPSLPIFSAGGLASRLLAALTSSSPDTEPSLVEVNTIVAYVAEGDNRLDAKTFAHEVLSVFNHLRSDKGNEPTPISFDSLREPISWKASDSYQTQTRQDIYG